MKYLIETDWAIEYLRGNKKEIIEKLIANAEGGLGLSIISLAELYHGVYKSKDEKRTLSVLQNFLAKIKILLIDEKAADTYGREISRLGRQGQTLDNFDLLIGATALRYNLILLTNNRKHFERIKGLEIQSIV